MSTQKVNVGRGTGRRPDRNPSGATGDFPALEELKSPTAFAGTSPQRGGAERVLGELGQARTLKLRELKFISWTSPARPSATPPARS